MWARFSSCSRETRAITKAFKNIKIKVIYSTKNTFQKLLMGNHHLPQKSKYEKSGIYQITCPTCNMKYTGQTDSRSTLASENTCATSKMDMANPDLPSTC